MKTPWGGSTAAPPFGAWPFGEVFLALCVLGVRGVLGDSCRSLAYTVLPRGRLGERSGEDLEASAGVKNELL